MAAVQGDTGGPTDHRVDQRAEQGGGQVTGQTDAQQADMGRGIAAGAGLSTVGTAYLARLSEIAGARDRRIHAVVDGARFSALAAKLSAAGLCHRPLYRQVNEARQAGALEPNPAVVLGGPWLVSLSSAPARPVEAALSAEEAASDEALSAFADRLAAEMADAIAGGDESGGGMLPSDGIDRPDEVALRIEALLTIIGDRPSVVFWIAERDLSDEAMFRHLRGINRILVPQDGAPAQTQVAGRMISAPAGGGDAGEIALAAGADEDAGEEPAAAGRGRFEAVVFRHADPNVMMQVFPCLSPEQVSRLMGPADQMFFAPDAEWGGGIKRGRRPQGVVAEKGMLRLTADTIAQISESRLNASRHRRIASFRQSAPHLLSGMDDREAAVFMARHEAEASAHGIRSERGFFQWTYLMAASNGRFIHSPEIAGHLKGGNADTKLDEMMRLMANAAREGLRA